MISPLNPKLNIANIHSNLPVYVEGRKAISYLNGRVLAHTEKSRETSMKILHSAKASGNQKFIQGYLDGIYLRNLRKAFSDICKSLKSKKI